MFAVSRAPPCVTAGIEDAGGLPEGGPVVLELTAGVALLALPVVGVKVELDAVVGLEAEEPATLADPVEAEAANPLLAEVPDVEAEADVPARTGAWVFVESCTMSLPCTARLSLLFFSSRLSVSAERYGLSGLFVSSKLSADPKLAGAED